MKQVILFLFFGLFLTCAPTYAQTVFMKVQGAIQGSTITDNAGTPDSAGPIAVAGQEDNSIVFAMEFTSKFDLDPSTGVITGDALPCVLKVKKIVDSASPLLFQALVTEESLEVSLKYYRTSTLGTTENYYEIKLTNAKVAAYRMLSQETPLVVGTNEVKDFEEVTFTYTQIELSHLPAGTASSFSY